MGAVNWFLVMSCCFAADEAALKLAHSHLARGRYAEAVEAFETLLAESPQNEPVVLGCVAAHAAQGERDQAETLLDAFLKRQPHAPQGWAYRARLHWERGQLAEAAQAAQQAMQRQPDCPLARLIQAHVWVETGQLKEASEGYRWFVRYYNRVQPRDAETLLIIGEGAAQYARWHSVAQIFDFLVNTLCVDALKADPECWQAHYLAGTLLLEKYNSADALPELKAALAINPQAVPVHLALAADALERLQTDAAARHIDRALAVDPHHPEALRLQAQLFLHQGRLTEAHQSLAQALHRQPVNQVALALRAYLLAVQGDLPAVDRFRDLLAHLDQMHDWRAADSEFERLIVDLAQRNPRPGYFLSALGRLFEQDRKFAYAECCYRQAIASMPQLAPPKSELGMLYFQTGRLPEAQKLLDDAFKADPYHVRVSNMRKVLRVLEGYGTVSTPHFVIRADSQLDGVLARYMAEYLEEIYAEITQRYGFEPPQRTQIEVYNQAKGLAGHQWFSARMIGLPWLQTIGASTGTIVALTSPAATAEPYNWARVLRHEFVHVVTIQQTDFNIPHWLTEALATREEGYPPPPEWNELLRQRVAQNNLRNLDNLHLGFQRAESREDWTFAYCQSVLYAEYFVQRFGEMALVRLLDAYHHTRSTEQALRTAFGVDKADVEAGYLQFLKERVAKLNAQMDDGYADPARIRQEYAERPHDPATQAAYAALQFRLGRFAEAQSLAEKVLARDPAQPLAAAVRAQGYAREERWDDAQRVLLPAFREEQPHPRVLLLLAQVHLQRGDAAAALRLFQLGRRHFPDRREWLSGMVQAAEMAGDEALLQEALEAQVATDADDAGPRVRLAQMAYDRGDFSRAARFARLALHIDVLDAEVHILLARALRRMQQFPAAHDAYSVALSLKPGVPNWELEYAEALWDGHRQDEARSRLDAFLARHPDDAAAKALRQRWSQSGKKK